MAMQAHQRDWDAVRERLHNRWPALSEDELDQTQGDRESLVALLQAKYGYARENAEGDLDRVIEMSIAPGPFIAENSDDPNEVAQSGTIDRPLEREIELSTGLTSHYLLWPHEGARTMLLLHGLGGCAADWMRVAAHFQGRFNVVALDQRGHGQTHVPGGPHSADDHIADVGAFIEAAELEQPILVGHSMGAHHALGYAADHSDRVSAVVVSGLEAGSDSQADLATRMFASAQEYVDALRRQSPSAPDWALWSLAGARLHEVRGGFQPRAEAAAVMEWRAPEALPEGLNVPILVLTTGESADPLPAFANADTEQLPRGGPNPYIDDEEAFLAAVDRFVAARGLEYS